MSFYATTYCPSTTYGPFGNIESQTGVLAEDNVYRFSTKYFDSETELRYFGFRYYNAKLGRWLNRDPIGENGGLNLSEWCHNNGINWIDAFGLEWTIYTYDFLVPFEIENIFVGGYGLDIEQYYRNVPYVGEVNLDWSPDNE
jgi:RHS repeat-associated protein